MFFRFSFRADMDRIFFFFRKQLFKAFYVPPFSSFSSRAFGLPCVCTELSPTCEAATVLNNGL